MDQGLELYGTLMIRGLDDKRKGNELCHVPVRLLYELVVALRRMDVAASNGEIL